MAKKVKRNGKPFYQPKTSCDQKSDFILQKIDIFGKPISFTYNNEDSFRTNLGGISTIAL